MSKTGKNGRRKKFYRTINTVRVGSELGPESRLNWVCESGSGLEIWVLIRIQKGNQTKNKLSHAISDKS
jgi:hypothetical protein